MDQLTVVLEHFPRSSLHIEIAEEMLGKPEEALRRIYQVLGVDSQVLPLNVGRQVNTYVEFRSLALRRLTQRLPRAIAKPMARINVKADAKYPPMPPSSRIWLEGRFRDGNRRLAEFLGRDTLW
jgi:hypothetical protein